MMRAILILISFCAAASAQTEISACGFTATVNGTVQTPHVYTITQDLVQTAGENCINLTSRRFITLDGANHKITHGGIAVVIGTLRDSAIQNVWFDAVPFDGSSSSHSAIWKGTGTTSNVVIRDNIFTADLAPQTVRYQSILMNNNIGGGFQVLNNVFRHFAQGNQTQDSMVTNVSDPGAFVEFADNLIFIDGAVTSQGQRHKSILLNPQVGVVAAVHGNKAQFASPTSQAIWGGNTELAAMFCEIERKTNQDPDGTGPATFANEAEQQPRDYFIFNNEIVSYTPSRLIALAGCDGGTVYRNRFWSRGDFCFSMIRARDSITEVQAYENWYDLSGNVGDLSCPAFGAASNYSQRASRTNRAFDNVIVGASGAGQGFAPEGGSTDNWFFNNSMSGMDSGASGGIFHLTSDGVPTEVDQAVIVNGGSGYTTAKLFVEVTGAASGGVHLEPVITGGVITGVDIITRGRNFDFLCPGGRTDPSCGVIQAPRVIVDGDGTGAEITLTMRQQIEQLVDGMQRNAYDYNASDGLQTEILRYSFASTPIATGGEWISFFTATSYCGSTHNNAALDATNIFAVGDAAAFPDPLAEFRTAGNCECENVMPAVPKRFFNETTGQPDTAETIACGPTAGARVDLGSPVAPDVPTLIDDRIAAFGGGDPPGIAKRRARGQATIRGAGRVR